MADIIVRASIRLGFNRNAHAGNTGANTGVLFPSFALIVADVFDCALPGSYKNRPYNRDYQPSIVTSGGGNPARLPQHLACGIGVAIHHKLRRQGDDRAFITGTFAGSNHDWSTRIAE